MDNFSSFLDDEIYFYQPRAFNSTPKIAVPRKKFLPVFCLLDNTEGFFIVGTNSFTSPICEGNFIGVESFESIRTKNMGKAVFSIPKRNTVTGLKFLNSDMFVAATMDNTLEVFKKQSSIDNENSPKFHRLSELDSEGFVQNIEKLSGESKFICGTDQAHLSIYDYGSSDIFQTSHYAYAQSSPISGLSSHPTSQRIWTSCAGFECLLWDQSKKKPALTLLKHDGELRAVHWSSQEENNETVVIGDEIGNIMTVDIRKPRKIITSTRVNNRPISAICFNGSKRFGVISSNSVDIIEAGVDFKTVFQYKAKQMLYAGKWDKADNKIFYVVGDRKTALKFYVS